VVAGEPRDAVAIELPLLARHTVILAGAGSGKTVLARRLIEEAALLGVPSIVIDPANDLARLGEPWPEPPASWLEDDARRSEAYQRRAEVVVWTPGRAAGNPLHLSPLPDFLEVRDDPDQLREAVEMARETLEPLLAPGSSARAQKKRGVLSAALRYLAERGDSRLTDLVALLSDLPPEASAGIGEAERMAAELADQLRAALETDALLGDEGAALDPARLLTASTPDKTRVSVVSLLGLASLGAQQGFVNRLAMTLFGWLKRHPAPAHAPLQGLLLIDETRDFIPAGQAVPCRGSLLRLTAQARKYGLGLVFATQTPRSIDHNVIANCTTQVFGRANSPTAIEVVREQLRLRGGNGDDVARLPAGTFYLHGEGLDRPVRIRTPMCLTYHPATPLEADEVLRRANVSRGIA
jgi:DNA helicase HerA-like ATPase